METKANYVLIGAFTIAGFLGIMGFLMWFAKLELNRQFAYYDVYFPEVAGLSVSSDVRFAGLEVGKVVDMRLAPDRGGTVRVRLELAEGTPVRTDSTASIEAQAVTGVASVAISPGSNRGALLSEVSQDAIPVIRAGQSTLQTLGQQAPELLAQLNTLAGQLTTILGEENQGRVAAILENVERSTGNLDKTISDVSTAADLIASATRNLAGFGDRLGGLSETAETAMNRFSDAAAQADATLGRVDSYIADDLSPLTAGLQRTVSEMQTDFAGLGDRVKGSLDRLDAALDSAGDAFVTADDVISRDLGPVMTDLRETLGNVNTALAGLPEDLPQISAKLREAAESAAGAYDSLGAMLDSARSPVQDFSQQALPQLSRLSSELRGLVENVNQLVSALKRNPARIFSDPPTPEFRR